MLAGTELFVYKQLKIKPPLELW